MPIALVVAGGYSSRFGLAEKGLVEIGGEPMLAHVVGALESVAEDVVIDCRDDQAEPFESALASSAHVDGRPTFVTDEEPDAGPIAGIENGLSTVHTDRCARIDDGEQNEEIHAEEILLVSCDRPGITPAVLGRLLDRRRQRDADVALPAVDGYLQPLCGAYRTDALERAVADARTSGERQLCSVPASLSKYVVAERSLADIVSPGAIASVDTPLELWVRSHPARPRSTRDDNAVSARLPDGSALLAGD
ncbi:molybdenum cofactor guanylyltransferase [Salinarchaeum chitinilyticum]